MNLRPENSTQSDINESLDVSRREAARRINRAIDFLFEHIAEPVTIAQLAAQANFSPHHFVRVFAQVTGETPAAHLRRARLERAASLLYAWPHRSILDVAMASGFQSAAVFSRAFRSHFGMTPRAWRRADFWRPCGLFACWRPLPCGECEHYGELFGTAANSGALAVRPWPATRPRGLDQPRIQTLRAQRVAYVRSIGPLENASANARRLRRWVAARGLLGPDTAFFGQLVADPHITASRHFISDAGVFVPDTFTADRYVNVRTVPGGTYLTARFEGSAADTVAAIRYLWYVAVPEHGCVSAGWLHHHRIALRDNTTLADVRADSILRWNFFLPVTDKQAVSPLPGALPIDKGGT